jgi:succinate dehydrogenase / fumarate reductase cytochrome b subunit
MALVPDSTIGKKIVVAVTGVILLGFVVGHLAGNLQIFEGPEKINAYSAFLKHAYPLLWGTRIVLLISILLHIICTVQLAVRNRAGRPVGYDQHAMVQASFASRFMIWSGAFLGFYIVYHLLHLTLGVARQPFSETDVYANLVTGFSVPAISSIYILGMICLGFHLNHGIYSVFQTLGLNHPKYNCWRKLFAVGASILIAAGYISIPVAVMTGIIHR